MVVCPSDPIQTKGLLLSAIRSNDPVIFLEPKALYRNAEADVPKCDYMLELSKAHVRQKGKDITLIGWGNMVRVMEKASLMAKENDNIECEVIDL